MEMIDAILFDAYGTLFDITGEDWARPEVVATMRQKQLQYSWLLSLIGEYRDFREVTRSAIAYALAQHHVEGISIEDVMRRQLAIQLFPDVPATLERLGRGKRLGILSNGHPESLDSLLRNSGLGKRFTWVISAHEVRVYKPSPAVYRLAVDRANVTRDRLLFVSANGWDAAGAAAFGLRVAWVNRGGLPAEAVGGRPELVVTNLLELAEAVGARERE